jgi:drug/metabolite transporter (DMT)-like permease
MRPTWVTFISGLLLLIPATLGLFLTGVPTVFCPLPALTILPLFLFGDMHVQFVPVVIPLILFFVWNPDLFRGGGTIPKRTHILFVFATVLSVIWFIGGWNYGLQYQGPTYTHLICALNVAWIAGLGVLLFRRRKLDPSFASNLVFHLLFFAWLSWYAFPYLGELP